MPYPNLTQTVLGEGSFGPIANEPGDSRFDFTLLFEQSVLIIGPSALLLLAVPFRTRHLLGQCRKVLRAPNVWLKISTYIVLGLLQLVLLAQWASFPVPSLTGRLSVAASTLSLVGTAALCVLSILEHDRSVRPSSIICAYLLLSLLAEVAYCRTLWLIGTLQAMAVLSTVVVALKLLILALEVQEKRSILLDSWRSLGPESTSGLLSRGLFWWLNRLLIRGFSANLSLQSLYTLDEKLESTYLLRRIKRHYYKKNTPKKHALLFSLLRGIRGSLTWAIFPRLCLMCFKFSQPFLIKGTVEYIQEPIDKRSSNHGYALIAGAGLIYSGIAVSTGFYQHQIFRTLTMIRGSLVSLIFSQALDLDSTTSSGSSTLTHITADVDKISEAFQSFHEIWANVIEIGLATWLLQRQLGLGCLGPALVVIVCTVAMSQLSRFMGPAVRNWNDAIQNRVSTTASVVTAMRETKLLGMERTWTDTIQLLRSRELNKAAKFRTLITYMNILGNAPATLAPVATFGIALAVSNYGKSFDLTISTAFASLAIMGLIVGPLAELLAAVPSFVASLGCFDRLQSFLHTDAMVPKRGDDNFAIADSARANDEDGIELNNALSRCRTGSTAIVTQNACFRYRSSERDVLRNINICLQPGSYTVLMGPIGSGKTTLLRGLLGEVPTTGSVQIPSAGAAYCTQTTWLTNTTIKQNILGQSEMESGWYNAVVHACALDQDLNHITDGDLAKVGSQGVTLSGGQRQRIALARAIYSRKPVMLIDDVLSGLDWTTRGAVWARVFGPSGLLRRQGTTVLLVTHDVDLVDKHDQVIILGRDGEICAQGRFRTIRGDVEVDYFTSKRVDDSPKSTSDVEATSASELKQPDRTSVAPSQEDKDALTHRTGDLTLYCYYLTSIGRVHALTALALGIAAAVSSVAPAIWIKFWTETRNNQSAVDTAKFFGIFAVLSIVALATIGASIWWSFVIIIPKSGRKLHQRLLKAVMRAPLSFHTATDTGSIINRFSKDMSLVDGKLPTDFHMTMISFLCTITEAALVLLGATYQVAILPVAGVFLYCLQKFYLRTSRQLRLLDLETTGPLHTHVLETIEGLATIRAFGWKSATHDVSMKLLNNAQKPHYLLFCVQRWLQLVLDLFVAVCAVLLVALGILLPHTSSPGAMALALSSLLGLSQSLAGLIAYWTALETSLGAISRLRQFEKSTPIETTSGHTTSCHPQEPPEQWPSRGRLEVNGITASYSTNPGAEPVLRGVSIDAKPGEKVAICGRTGSGKSSLLLTLFRLLDIAQGTIMLDDVDVSQVAHNTMRERLISVPQEPTLFPGTLRFNLHPMSTTSPPVSDDEMIRVLEQAELWSAIATRGNLDTDVHELALSHGQKQLVCLARAILRRKTSAVVILDEAMSAVDKHTEDVMVKMIETEFARHTVLSVVHRLNTILQFDRVIVMDRGEVVEVGKPTELLERRDGSFRALWDGQAS